MAKKVSIIKDACMSCGLCIGSLPSVFEFGPDDKAEVIVESTDEDVESVAAECPAGAIVVE